MNNIRFSNCNCEIVPGKFNAENIPLICKATWDLLSSGFTTGVFQLESRLGMDWCRKLQPQNIEELAALISIIRPSCLESGISEDYVDIKFGRKNPDQIHPIISEILKSTYGCMIYQEQALKIATEIAGLSLEDADSLRKAIGKKIPELMSKLKSKFIDGCINKGLVNKETGEKIFSQIEKGQRYGFNKSHAISYAMLGYCSAYIKCHFPQEFFTSYLTYSNYKSDPMEEIYRLVQDARLFNIPIYQPDITRKNIHFEMAENNGIRFGLSHIKGVGQSAIEKIISLSKEDLDTWPKFLKAVPSIHRNIGIALIKSGACDCYGLSRSTMIQELEAVLGSTIKDSEGKNKNIGGLTAKELDRFYQIFDKNNNVKLSLQEMVNKNIEAIPLSSMKKQDLINYSKSIITDKEIDGMNKNEILDLLKDKVKNVKMFANKNRIESVKNIIESLDKEQKDTSLGNSMAEKFFLGISLSCSPVDDIDDGSCTHNCLDVAKALNGTNFSVCAVIDNVKHTKTKKGKNPGAPMCFLTISDSTYSIEHAVVFPDFYEELSSVCKNTNICIITGQKKNGSIIINGIKKLI